MWGGRVSVDTRACICEHAGMRLWTRGRVSVSTCAGACDRPEVNISCLPLLLPILFIETGSLNLVVIDPASLAGQWAPGISCLHPHPHPPSAGVTAMPDLCLGACDHLLCLGLPTLHNRYLTDHAISPVLLMVSFEDNWWTDEGQRRGRKFCSETLGKLKEDKGGWTQALKLCFWSRWDCWWRRQEENATHIREIHSARRRWERSLWGQELVAPASQWGQGELPQEVEPWKVAWASGGSEIHKDKRQWAYGIET